MNRKVSNDPSNQADSNTRQLYAILEGQSWLNNAIKIYSVPLRLTQPLIDKLLSHFQLEVEVEQFRQLLSEFGLVIQWDEDEWRLDRTARQYFLDRLEQEDPTLARQVHATVLDYLKTTALSTLDEDHSRLQRAYHTTPSDPDAGAGLYWSTYCRSRASNRFAMLPVLAHLAESQANWLIDHEQDVKLYRAAALYYGGPTAGKPRTAELLEGILEQGASIPITIDATFLLGTLREQTDRDEAAKLYEQATTLGDDVDLRDKDRDVQRHLRLTIAKSFFNLASIMQTKDGPRELDEAERCYRRGIQIVAAVEPGYEAAQRRHLVQVLKMRGEEDKAKHSSQRISQIEDPFRQRFLEEAFSRADDIGYLYYAISALNHGLGYDSQLIQIEVGENGNTQLEGTYTLRATSVLSQTDFYLKTVPESEVGVHFESLESLTPAFTLNLRRLNQDSPEVERLEMIIDPPMQPGDTLTYRWTAKSSPGAIATTPQQLEDAGLDYEYVFWDIIVPMKRLEIQAVIPVAEMRSTPPVWVELWRIGQWHTPTPVQTAYRALVEDDPSPVRWLVNMRPPNNAQLGMKVDYPWLAMRYVLAWGIKG